MATATIPELIQPGTLYTPDDSAISVSTGVLPNGDPHLVLDGSVGNYRAYQPAISGIHYPASPSDPMALVFFIGPFGTNNQTGNALGPGGTIAGVMDINAPSGNTSVSSSTTGFAWALTWYSSNSGNQTLRYHRSVGATSRAGFGTGASLSSAGLLVLNDPGGGVAPSLRYNGVNPVGLSSAVGGTPGTPGALTSPYFGIGPYSTATGWGVNNKAMTLAKFAIFNRVLTPTEMSDLYTSMTLGPPSP